MNATLTAPAKFDRRAIATAAWSLVKTAGKTLSEGMKAAWAAAKQTVKNVMNTFFTASTKSGKIFQVEARIVLNSSCSANEVAYFIGEHRVAAGIHQGGQPIVSLTERVILNLLEVKAKGGYLVLDRDFRPEAEALLVEANAAAEAVAAAFVAALPRTTLVQASEHAGTYGISVSARIEGVELPAGVAGKLVSERLATLAKAAKLTYSLRPGYEASFDAAPLTLAALLGEAEPVLAAKQTEAVAETARVAACFTEAARTGQPVKIRAWVEERGDMYDVVEYAQPDGTRRTRRFNME